MPRGDDEVAGASLLVAVGDSNVLLVRLLERVERALAGAAGGEPHVQRLSAGEADLVEVLRDWATPTLFGAPPLILIREADAVLAGWAGPLTQRMSDAQGVLVLQVSGRPTGEAAKRLKEAGVKTISVASPTGRALHEALAAEARRTGLRLSPGALREVAARSSEFDEMVAVLKVLSAAGEAAGPEDVIAVMADRGAGDEYALSNAVEARDLSAALDALRRAFENGLLSRSRGHDILIQDRGRIAQRLVMRLHGSIKRLRTAAALPPRTGPEEAAGALGMRGRAAAFVPRILSTASRMRRKLRFAPRGLARCDLQIKTGSEPRLALEAFVCWLLS